MDSLEGIVRLVAIVFMLVVIFEWVSLPFTINSIEKKLNEIIEIIEIMKER